MHVVIKVASFTSEYTYIVEWKLMINTSFCVVSGKTHLGLLGMHCAIACVNFIEVSHHLKAIPKLKCTWMR